jgi:hypothetical protein
MAGSRAAPVPEAPVVVLACTSDTFAPVPGGRVRWLDRPGDFALVREAWAARGVPVTRADWDDWRGQGYRYSGIAVDGRLVASAAVWAYSIDAWELAAVRTGGADRSRGYSRAVCSFATAYILANGRRATCGTRADNAAMLKVATSLDFRPVDC